jgi:hypothetical protein
MRAWPVTARRTEPPKPAARLPGHRDHARRRLTRRRHPARWPSGFLPVSVLRDRNLRQPDPRTVVRSGGRIALLTPDLFLTGSEEKINNQ